MWLLNNLLPHGAKKWKLYPLPLHTITLSPTPNVSMSSYLKAIYNFCNFGGSLMKDPGKWNGSIDYINGTKMEGIISRYEKVSGYNNYVEKLLRIWFRDISGVQHIMREKS